MRLLFALLSLTSAMAGEAADPAPDRWQPVRFLIGSWRGDASGEPGKGRVERTYQLVLGDRFIEERNVSTYEPRSPDKPAEVHQHRSFVSYDKARKTFMLRQFHQEGFVNLYALNQAVSTPTRLVFESVSFENLGNDWRARETYQVVSSDEFVEIFELAEPGKEFQVYSTNHFWRKR
jgi:hypothetical protein